MFRVFKFTKNKLKRVSTRYVFGVVFEKKKSRLTLSLLIKMHSFTEIARTVLIFLFFALIRFEIAPVCYK
jgi:hypothetical protein